MHRTATATAAVAIALVAGPAQAGAVKYEGKTNQGAKITFNVSGKKVTKLASYIAMSCLSPQTSTPRGGADYYRHPGAARVGATVKAKQRQPSALAYGEPTMNYTTTIKRQGNKLVGKLEKNFSYYEPDLYYPKTWFCTGVAKFTAKPR